MSADIDRNRYRLAVDAGQMHLVSVISDHQ